MRCLESVRLYLPNDDRRCKHHALHVCHMPVQIDFALLLSINNQFDGRRLFRIIDVYVLVTHHILIPAGELLEISIRCCSISACFCPAAGILSSKCCHALSLPLELFFYILVVFFKDLNILAKTPKRVCHLNDQASLDLQFLQTTAQETFFLCRCIIQPVCLFCIYLQSSSLRCHLLVLLSQLLSEIMRLSTRHCRELPLKHNFLFQLLLFGSMARFEATTQCIITLT